MSARYRGRQKPPPREILDAITAAAARGDDVEVARLAEQVRREHVDRRRQATPLPIVDAAEVVRRIDAEERNR